MTQIIVGPLVGVAFGLTFAKAMDAAQDQNLMAESAGGVAFLSVAFAAYIGAEIVGGNGFIAAFIAGMVFGALLLPDGLDHVTWKVLLLAVLFLTVVRILPIAAWHWFSPT